MSAVTTGAGPAGANGADTVEASTVTHTAEASTVTHTAEASTVTHTAEASSVTDTAAPGTSRPGADAPGADAPDAASSPTLAAVDETGQVRRRRRLSPGRRLPASRLVGPALVLALWAVASAAGQLDPAAIPAPWTVLETGVRLWTDGTLTTDIVTSLQRAGSGFAIGLTAGVALALVSGLSRTGEALIDGTVQLNRAIPTLGLIPLFILWLGIGETFKIAIIAIVVYIPIYLNTHAALAGIDSRFVELAEVQGLSRFRFVRQIVVPGALPGFFVGLRLGVTGSWLGLVVLEQINATNGLGYMMFQATNYGQSDVILVGLAVYGIFGLVSDGAVRLIERRVLSWRRTLSS